ncbi:hypothetical protein Tco_1051919 [Tanacetum coccineum]
MREREQRGKERVDEMVSSVARYEFVIVVLREEREQGESVCGERWDWRLSRVSSIGEREGERRVGMVERGEVIEREDAKMEIEIEKGERERERDEEKEERDERARGGGEEGERKSRELREKREARERERERMIEREREENERDDRERDGEEKREESDREMTIKEGRPLAGVNEMSCMDESAGVLRKIRLADD